LGTSASTAADLAQQVAHVGLDDGAAAVEHRPAELRRRSGCAGRRGRHVERICEASVASVGLAATFLDLLLEFLELGLLGADLLGLQGLQVDGLALGLDLAALDLAGLRVRSCRRP
jgi:hypothetical protein